MCTYMVTCHPTRHSSKAVKQKAIVKGYVTVRWLTGEVKMISNIQ